MRGLILLFSQLLKKSMGRNRIRENEIENIWLNSMGLPIFLTRG